MGGKYSLGICKLTLEYRVALKEKKLLKEENWTMMEMCQTILTAQSEITEQES